MIFTAYLVVNATSVYTAGDTHINDMQLEAIGSDALNLMGIQVNNSATSNFLNKTIVEKDGTAFSQYFLQIVNASGMGPKQDIQFIANYTCRNNNGIYPQILSSSNRALTGGEHPVRVTKWVIVNKPVSCDAPGNSGVTISGGSAVLVEVLLWRD